MTHSSSSDLCPVCNGSHWRDDALAGRLLGIVEPYRVEFCRGCGQGRLVPQLSAAELKALYDGSYFNSTHGPAGSAADWQAPVADYVSQVVPERLAKFSQTLRNLRRLAPQARTLLDVGAATGDIKQRATVGLQPMDWSSLSSLAAKRACATASNL